MGTTSPRCQEQRREHPRAPHTCTGTAPLPRSDGLQQEQPHPNPTGPSALGKLHVTPALRGPALHLSQQTRLFKMHCASAPRHLARYSASRPELPAPVGVPERDVCLLAPARVDDSLLGVSVFADVTKARIVGVIVLHWGEAQSCRQVSLGREAETEAGVTPGPRSGERQEGASQGTQPWPHLELGPLASRTVAGQASLVLGPVCRSLVQWHRSHHPAPLWSQARLNVPLVLQVQPLKGTAELGA